ncbi:MAG: M48 family metallopeptidase [Treponema sp.]|nr:M48 family metallopeptidase [Treponema sp.]
MITNNKRHFFTSVIVSIFSFALVSCLSSTTSSGAVGADRQQLMLVSEETMEQSAKESYAQVLAEAKAAKTLNTNSATTNRVRNIATRLIRQVGVFRNDALSWDWQINVITDDTVNAWCMPGGKIVVYTGIINTLSLTDGELAAVMGHEISHALKEHSREQASQDALTNVGIFAIAQIIGLGDLGTTVLALASQYTIALPFSRSHETEADRMGTELMARAGYDPYEAVNIWKKMAAISGSSVPEILSTHPSNESRIKDLQSVAEKVYPLYQSADKA